MVRVEYLDPFKIYQTKPPMIMPETEGNRKKGQSYVVIAPNIESELTYLASTTVLNFRYLSKYFIEKRWECKLYGQTRQVMQLNKDGDINKLIADNRKGNLKDITEVTSYLPTNKTDLLHQFNVLIEVNHIVDAILNNPKDARLMRLKIKDLIQELKRVLSCDYIGKYNRTIILPLELWFSIEDYSNPTNLLKPTSKNPMGVFLSMLCDPEILSVFGTILLVDGKIALKLDPESLPEKESKDISGFISEKILEFMRKAKNRVGSDDVDSVSDDSNTTSINTAISKTVKDISAEKAIEAINGNPDNISRDEAQKLGSIIEKKMNIASDSDTDDTITAITDQVKNVEFNDSNETDMLLKAAMSQRSAQSEQRNQMLKDKYRELKIGTVSMKDLMDNAEDQNIPTVQINARTINQSLNHITGHRFEETYEKTLAQKDLISILLHFSSASPAMYLNKDIEVSDVSTHTDRVMRYTVSFEDENRKRHRFSFKLPKMYKYKYLYLNGQELIITHQKLPYPITKVQPDRCQLVTNYNKIFVYRYGTLLSPRIVRLKKILSGNIIRNCSIKRGDCTPLNRSRLTTIEFDELANSFYRIQLGSSNNNVSFTFDPDTAAAIFNMNKQPKKIDALTAADVERGYGEDNTLFPIAIRKVSSGNNKTVTQYWLSGTTNIVYDDAGKAFGELSDFMTQIILEYNPNMEDELNNTTTGTKFMYSRVRIMSHDIPLILVMGAADPGGLIGALNKSKINYTFVEKRPTIDKTTQGIIPFADGYFVFDRYPYENSLLLNGLATFPSKEYNFYDMNVRDTYVDIFDLMCGQRSLADNLPAFYYMMIDPITKEVLETLDMPTDFTTLLHFCNGVLADNSYQIDSNYENSRIRSNEIIMAHLYRELAVAWSNYRSGRTDTFSIPEDIIIKLLLTSKIVDPKSKLNISLELENDRNVKLKGPSGMNEDHSFTVEKRAYHRTMRGVIATNSTPSGEVGINRHMVTNPNLLNARGFIQVNKDSYDGTELLSPGEMLQPFGAESADIERLCMAISQSKHLVPVTSQCSCPVSYDMERVAPYMSNDFAFSAKQDGKVIDITEDLMIVQYTDGTYDDIDLSEHPTRNTDGGFYIMNKMTPRFKVGSKFKNSDILAYDEKAINNNDFFGDPCANVGTLARVAFESNGSVFEDSGYITDDFAHRFATRITKQKRIILSKYANIKYIVKIGQSIQANDPILAFDDTEDEFSSQLLASITDQIADEDEVVATSAPIVSKYTGTIKDIQITYTVPTEDMTPSLRKVVERYIKDAEKREKVISKYRDIHDANSIVKSSEMAIPDSRGKVAGTKIDEGVIIDFYIEYEDVAGNGDKGSIGALKFTVCNVVPTELAGYTEFNPDRKIDVYVASFGAFKRMVADVEKIGILTKVLIESKRMLKDKYSQRIKDKIKNKI